MEKRGTGGRRIAKKANSDGLFPFLTRLTTEYIGVPETIFSSSFSRNKKYI
jgi:hypothetical protein